MDFRDDPGHNALNVMSYSQIRGIRVSSAFFFKPILIDEIRTRAQSSYFWVLQDPSPPAPFHKCLAQNSELHVITNPQTEGMNRHISCDILWKS